MTTAQTIFQQLGGGRFVMMTGSKGFLDMGNALSCKLGGGAVGKDDQKVTHLRVTLDASDTYTVETLYVRGTSGVRIVESTDGVYCDNLRSVVEKMTGFALTLPTIHRV